MKRRTLDYIFSVGGVVLAVLLLVLGLVMKSNADFAKSYVKNQLTAQKINFTPLAGLSDEEKTSSCLVAYAGTPMDSGKKAECYANDYINLHLASAATAAGYPGETYASIGAVQRGLKVSLQAATDAGKPTTDIQATIDTVNGLRDTQFKGETLRGLLLTSYGFSVFGEKGSQAELVAFLAALTLLLASIAGAIHAIKTPKDEVVLGTPVNGSHDDLRVPAHV